MRSETIMKYSGRYFIKLSIWLLAVSGLCIGAYFYWQHEKFYPSTNNAYIQANIIQIAPQISGQVSRVLVSDNQQVKRGQLLFEVDPRLFQFKVIQAKANLQNIEQQVQALEIAIQMAKTTLDKRRTQLAISRKNAKRILTLVKDGRASKQLGDDVQAKLEVAIADVHLAENELKRNQYLLGQPNQDNAQIQAAKSQLETALLTEQYTKIYAPADGVIAHLSLRQGDTVNANVGQFSLIEDNNWWISANFKETDLARIKAQQSVTIKIDMYPKVNFKGSIQSISPGSGAAFALLPAENASGNWVKVTQRFPIKIRLKVTDPRYPLRVGASCAVTVKTV